jgi:hypothetical protein
LYGDGPLAIVGGAGACPYCWPGCSGGGAYVLLVDEALMGCVVLGPLVERGDVIRGGAGPFGGGGGGVGELLAPNGGAEGGMTRFCWLGNGDVIGAGVALGVPRLEIAGLVTIGVSFQLVISFAREGGGTDGAVFLGGAPNEFC